MATNGQAEPAYTTTLQVTATPEWIARSLLTIARQPATPDDDAKWLAMVVGYIADRTPLKDAAPDLLAACKITLRLMREHGQTHDDPQGHDYLDAHDTGLSSPLSAVLENAIARAEGGAA